MTSPEERIAKPDDYLKMDIFRAVVHAKERGILDSERAILPDCEDVYRWVKGEQVNALPDDLWANEQRILNIRDLYVSDADEVEDSQFTIESTVPWVVIGASLILCSSVVMGLVGAMVGASATLMMLKRKAIGSALGRTLGVSES